MTDGVVTDRGSDALGGRAMGDRVTDPAHPVCDRCQVRSAGYALGTPSGSAAFCAPCFLRSERTVRRSLTTALVVGVVLTLINYGDALAAGHLTGLQLVKMPLNFVVPYVVATWGAMGAARSR